MKKAVTQLLIEFNIEELVDKHTNFERLLKEMKDISAAEQRIVMNGRRAAGSIPFKEWTPYEKQELLKELEVTANRILKDSPIPTLQISPIREKIAIREVFCSINSIDFDNDFYEFILHIASEEFTVFDSLSGFLIIAKGNCSANLSEDRNLITLGFDHRMSFYNYRPLL